MRTSRLWHLFPSRALRRPHARAEKRRSMLHLEALEDRTVLSALLVSDQLDYAPGSVATLTASGFDDGATLRFQVTSDTAGPGQSPWTVTDGITDGGAGDLDGAVNGSVQTTWLVDPDGAYIGATLTATATDVSLGTTASTVFTDGALTGVSVDSQVGTATYGTSNSVTFSIDVTGTGSNPRNWSLSVSGLPTGVTGTFSPPSGSGFGGPNDSSLTLTTTGTGPSRTLPGIYSFVVTATATGGTTGGPFTSSGTLTVGKKTLTVSGITASDKIYDGTTTATLDTTGAMLAGTVAGDSITLITAGATGTFNNKNVGPAKPVTVSGLTLGGPEATRYIVTQPSTTAAITQKALIGSFTAADKGYDGTTAATITSRTLIGVIGSDVVNYTGGAASFDDRNFGTGKTVTGTGFGLGGSGAGNYSVNTTATTTANISQAALDIFATSDSRTYDGTTDSAATPTVVGTIFAPDTVTGLDQVFDSRNAGPRTLSISAYTVNDGNGGNNYIVTPHTASGSISQASLEITAATNTKVYDGTTSAAAIPTVSGVQTGDSVTGLSEVYDNPNAGTGKVLSVATYTVNDGNGGNNYIVTTVANTTGVITPKALSIDAVTTQNALNIAKNGVIAFQIDVDESGIVDPLTVADLFNGASFSLKVGAQTYSVQSQAVVQNGIIAVSFRMSDELRSILAAYTTATSASTAPTVALELLATSIGGNYTIDATALTRLFNTTK